MPQFVNNEENFQETSRKHSVETGYEGDDKSNPWQNTEEG